MPGTGTGSHYGFDRELVSIHMPADNESSLEIGDMIENVGAASVEETGSVALRDVKIRRQVDLLPKRAAEVIELRYGIDSEPMTRSQVGKAFGVSLGMDPPIGGTAP